jgi:hypothetical protein
VSNTEYAIHRSLLAIHAPQWLEELTQQAEPIKLENVTVAELDALLSILYPSYALFSTSSLFFSASGSLAMYVTATFLASNSGRLSFVLPPAGTSPRSAPSLSRNSSRSHRPLTRSLSRTNLASTVGWYPHSLSSAVAKSR